jgi:tripartite ATP-independent transporter DctP family solute receptor
MNRKAISLLTLGVIGGVLSATMPTPAAQAAKPAAQPVVLRFGHVLPPTHPVQPAIEFMAQRISELSGGKMTVEVIGEGKLGTEPELIQYAKSGTVDLVKTSAAALEDMVPEMAVFGMPYMFRDDAHFWSILNGAVGKEILAATDAQGIHGLAYWDSGSRSFYTVKKPILKPADVRGLRLRVLPGKTAHSMVFTLGGTPTAIAYGDLYDALKKNKVDGAENNAPSFYTSRHYELAKHYSLDEHTRVPDMVVISKKVWDRLDSQTQGWIAQAAAESVPFERKLWKERNDEALKAMEKAGVTIHRIDREAFAAATAPMYTIEDGTRIGELARRIMEAE